MADNNTALDLSSKQDSLPEQATEFDSVLNLDTITIGDDIRRPEQIRITNIQNIVTIISKEKWKQTCNNIITFKTNEEKNSLKLMLHYSLLSKFTYKSSREEVRYKVRQVSTKSAGLDTRFLLICFYLCYLCKMIIEIVSYFMNVWRAFT